MPEESYRQLVRTSAQMLRTYRAMLADLSQLVSPGQRSETLVAKLNAIDHVVERLDELAYVKKGPKGGKWDP